MLNMVPFFFILQRVERQHILILETRKSSEILIPLTTFLSKGRPATTPCSKFRNNDKI
ncbi:unnamed protein product, partial [Brassica rapa]